MGKQLEKSIATHKERLAKAEARAAHLEAMRKDALYRKLSRARTSLESAVEAMDKVGLSGVNGRLLDDAADLLAFLMVQARVTQPTKEE